MTQPRSLYKPEERDNILGDISYEVTEIHNKLDVLNTVLLGVPNTSDSGLCGRVEKNEKKQTDFEKRIAGVGVGVLLALVAGVFALIS